MGGTSAYSVPRKRRMDYGRPGKKRTKNQDIAPRGRENFLVPGKCSLSGKKKKRTESSPRSRQRRTPPSSAALAAPCETHVPTVPWSTLPKAGRGGQAKRGKGAHLLHFHPFTSIPFASLPTPRFLFLPLSYPSRPDPSLPLALLPYPPLGRIFPVFRGQ